MNRKIEQLLNGNMDNYILPFFWVHGEEEVVLREVMQAIHNAHIGAVCVESRPHPDFVGEKWWCDMDVILDEARKHNMKVWILDDSHFPTGACNGEVEKADASLRRMYIVSKTIKMSGSKKVNIEKFLKEKKSFVKGEVPKDEMIAAVAVPKEGYILPIMDMTDRIEGSLLKWDAPDGYDLMLIKKSAHYGAHPSFMNMLDPDSVRILIDTVYESHYAHYKDDFGKTIAGFFSDEPELGNGKVFAEIDMGTDCDFPWSDKLIPMLENRLGAEWRSKLALVWCNTADPDETAYVRYSYMDTVTKAVSECFSVQLGQWCEEHGVQYIGHIIEDNDNHYRTGPSLGHYFRGLYGQAMAGLDDIGGQVYPQQEDENGTWMKFIRRDGEFYHYTLAKLGQSLAALDPKKQGNCVCEIFGNYGWQEGFKLERYLADHFMVRGINHYVPHAFTAKKFPDSGAPHYYAHGHNPQYRHFYVLMDYMNRVCSLIHGGRHDARVAMLYTGESAWVGEQMKGQVVGRILQDHQIDYDIVPMDAFTDTAAYNTDLREAFRVNTQTYKALVIPYIQYVSKELANVVKSFEKLGVPIYFIDALPSGIYDENDAKKAKDALAIIYDYAKAIPLQSLLNELVSAVEDVKPFVLFPANNRIRYMHYMGNEDLHYIVNEAADAYEGEIRITLDENSAEKFYRYNAWENRLEKIDYTIKKNGKIREFVTKVRIEPAKSLLLIADSDITSEEMAALPDGFAKQFEGLTSRVNIKPDWLRSRVKSIRYPAFEKPKKVTLPDVASEELPRFSGIFKYENRFELPEYQKVLLKITDAYEGIEVFVNGKSAGVQIAAPFEYDITSLVKKGENTIAIEVSTTLERERRAALNQGPIELLQHAKVKMPTGLTGEVNIAF